LDDGTTCLTGQWQEIRAPAFTADNLQCTLAPVNILQLQARNLSNP
jgi:hypothetical protein